MSNRIVRLALALLAALCVVACSDSNGLVGARDGSVGPDARVSRPRPDECGNGIDDDGNGRIDDGCPCGTGETQVCFMGAVASRHVGACTDGVQTCRLTGVEWGDWGDSPCVGGIAPTTEQCDGMDHDCDGARDEDCPCTAGAMQTCGLEFLTAPCMGGVQSCRADGTWSACDGAVGPTPDVCDGVDNDCDGVPDEGCSCVPEPEICRDGLDNDCDGEVDEPACMPDWPPADAGVPGPDGSVDCTGPAPPRLVAPMSTSLVTRLRPRLEWALAAGVTAARVQLCRDRACTSVIETLDVTGASGSPAMDLPHGVVFWRAFGLAGAVAGSCPSATWELFTGRRSTPVDTYWGTTLDLNGDGYADVAAGGDRTGFGAADSRLGHVYVYYGTAAGLHATPDVTLVNPIMPVAGDTEAFGFAVASAGDVNGDGFGDLVVGAMNTAFESPTGPPYCPASSGHAYVYLGSATGIATTSAATLRSPETVCEQFGQSVSSGGDLDHDGYGDLVIGAPNATFSGPTTGWLNRIYMFHGSATGVPSAPTTSVIPLPSSAATTGVGSMVTSCDVNGDRFSDVVASGGADYLVVYAGSATGVAATPLVRFGPDGRFITDDEGGLSGLDVNGDGFCDVVSSDTDGDSVGVYLGAAGTISTTPSQRIPLVMRYVSSAGDVDGDGYVDLVALGSSAVLLRGGAGGLSAAPSVTWSSVTGAYAVAGAGDIDGDGYPDVLVGARGAVGVGQVNVFRGGAALPATPSWTLIGPDGADGYFGASLATASSGGP